MRDIRFCDTLREGSLIMLRPVDISNLTDTADKIERTVGVYTQ